MAGHSKWANIKRRKGAVDAKRGKLFTKLVREIMTAARLGGGDPDGNARLRAAITDAKSQSVPGDTIARAVKKGAGDLEGESIEEIAYEGYGPAGVALYIETQTDNRNRTSADIRAAFTKGGGNLGQPNSVAWMFKKVGLFTFDETTYSEEQVMEVALDCGADDIVTEDGIVTATCELKSFGQLANGFDKAEMKYQSAELTMIPENTTKVAGTDAEKLFKLIDRLEDLDDVQKVHANFDIDDAEMERIAAG